MNTVRAAAALLAPLLGMALFGCSSSSDNQSSSSGPVNAAVAQQSGSTIQNSLAEVARVARGALLLQGLVRPGAFPSTAVRSGDRQAVGPFASDTCPSITFDPTESGDGFTLTLDYGPAPGCVDAFDGIQRSGIVTTSVADITYDPLTFIPTSGTAHISLANFRMGGEAISGTGTVDIVSLTLESWNLDLTRTGPVGSEHLTFHGVVTAEIERDVETINGTGTWSGGNLELRVSVSDLQYDFFNGQTSLVCDEPVGGSVTVAGANAATLNFGYPMPGCGFANLTIQPSPPSRVSLNETPRSDDAVDLVLGVDVTPVPALVGGHLAYTLTVFNAGADATDVTLTDVLPTNVQWVSSTTTQGACTGSLTVTCRLGDLPRLRHAVVTIVGLPTQVGFIANTASVISGSDENTVDNTFTVRTLVVGREPVPSGVDLVLDVTVDPDAAASGQDLTFITTVSNQGENTASGVVLMHSLPFGVEWNSSTTTQGSCTGNAPVTCSLGSLGPGGTATVTVAVTVTFGGTLYTSVSVSSAVQDDVFQNNTVSLTFDVFTPGQTPSRIEITPAAPFALGTGSTRQFSAGVYFDPATFPQCCTPVTWTSNNDSVIRIGSNGLATAMAIGTATITAAAGGVTSNAVTVSVEEVRTIALPTNDLVYDRQSQRLYASVPSRAGARGNTVTAIDPATGTIEWSEFVGSEPGKLALSDNGQWLYVALDGATGVQRFNVATRALDIQFGVGSDPNFGAYRVGDMAVLPGQPGSVAVSRSASFGVGIAVYDEGVQRPTTAATSSFGADSIAFSNLASTLYAFGSRTLQTLTVGSSGLTVSATTNNLISSFESAMKFSGGRLYFLTGQVVNPVTPEVVGTFTLTDPNTFYSPVAVEPDASSGRTFFLLNFNSPHAIKAYDQQTFRPLGTLELQITAQTQFQSQTGSLRRWGSNGLAFRTNTDHIVLARTALVP